LSRTMPRLAEAASHKRLNSSSTDVVIIVWYRCVFLVNLGKSFR
jgi:hypothetical protein